VSIINSSKRLRFGTIHKGLTRAKERLITDLNSESPNSFDINSSICELLFWVNANDEWHFKNRNVNKSYENKRKSGQFGANKLLGLKHAYNASKHNMDYLKLFTSKETKDFLGYQMEDFSSPPVWMNCPGSKKYKNQVKNYRKYLKGREVLTTFNEAITFLSSVNAEYRSEFCTPSQNLGKEL